MSDRMISVELARIEGAHLADLVSQFAGLLDNDDSSVAGQDPAVLRLVPDGYADPEAAREFRSLTEKELLSRRSDDAIVVLASLAVIGDLPDDPDDPRLVEPVHIFLDADEANAWLRTLAAVRLVLATRLGIVNDDDHAHDDPRFGIYDWLGFRLDGLVRAIDSP